MKKLTDKEKWDLLNQSQTSLLSGEGGQQSQNEEVEKNLGEIGFAYLVEIVSHLASDSAAEFLRNYPDDVQHKILAELPLVKKVGIADILSYSPGTCGAVMAKEYMAVPETLTAGEAIEQLQQIPAEEKGRLPLIFGINAEGILTGVLQIEDLFFSSKSSKIFEIMKTGAGAVSAESPQAEAARLIQESRAMAVPVIGREGRLAGVVSSSSVIQMIREEADREIAKMVGTDAEEMKTRSAFKILKLRMPWLFVNIASGLLCAFISGVFEHSMESVAVLLLFIPVVLGLSESTGIQGATIVVRNLSAKKIPFRELGWLFLKEVFVGIVIGFICGVIVGSAAFLWKQDWVLGVAMSISLNVAIIFSAVIGLLLPVLFKTIKIDPAIASGPLVLAICDIQTMLVYFNIAGRILSLKS